MRLLHPIGLAALPILLQSNGILVRAQTKNVCLIMYMMADNDLESSIFFDMVELWESDAIVQPNLNTWIYFDGHGNMTDFDGDGHGDSIFGDDGAIYMNFDHDLGDIIYTQMGEVNSDTPGVLCSFIETALSDCVGKGSEEFMLTFSSHGAGHGGFGGDENIGQRRLIQSNADIIKGIQCGLDAVNGAPFEFDIIGFDSCLMSSFLAVRDYSPYAKHILASEATEPAHGWYWNLSQADNALSIATELYSTFFSETQNPFEDKHLTPKTLALIDTDGFEQFLSAYEKFVGELSDLLAAETDQDFFASIHRSRATVTAFESYEDLPGSKTPSAVDIGSFLSTFKTQCLPKESSSLFASLNDAINTYEAIYTAQDVGPGTRQASGMAIYFPSKRQWNSDTGWMINDALWSIDDGDTSDAWLDFLVEYLMTYTPETTQGESICTTTFRSDIPPQFEGQLLLNPDLKDADGLVVVTSDITVNTDFVVTEYGFHAKGLLDETTRRRVTENARQPSASFKSTRYYTSRGKRMKNNHSRKAIFATEKSNEHRSIQEGDNEYLLQNLVIFNGALPSEYSGPTYSGTWSKRVYLLVEGLEVDNLNPFVFADSLGDGSMSVPVLYFPWYVDITPDLLPPVSLLEDALEFDEAYFAEITFSVDESTGEVISPLSLYTNADPGDGPAPIYEMPRDAGGYVVPIIYAEVGYEDGNGEFQLEFLEMTGFLHNWGLDLFALPLDAADYAEVLGDEMVFDVFAFDLDLNETDVGGFDFFSFDYKLGGNTESNSESTTEGDKNGPTNKESQSASESSSGVRFIVGFVTFLPLFLNLFFAD